jgi:hypothetical protein
MSRRRRKRPTLGDRKLPLNSPNWVPLNDAYRQGTARLGSSDFAIADLQRGLKADQDDPLHLHSKMRPLIGAEELLDAAFWHDFGLARWNEGLTLVARTDRRLSGSAVIYVWKPDLEKIWPTEAPASGESFPTDGAAPRRRPETYGGLADPFGGLADPDCSRRPEAVAQCGPIGCGCRHASRQQENRLVAARRQASSPRHC